MDKTQELFCDILIHTSLRTPDFNNFSNISRCLESISTQYFKFSQIKKNGRTSKCFFSIKMPHICGSSTIDSTDIDFLRQSYAWSYVNFLSTKTLQLHSTNFPRNPWIKLFKWFYHQFQSIFKSSWVSQVNCFCVLFMRFAGNSRSFIQAFWFQDNLCKQS